MTPSPTSSPFPKGGAVACVLLAGLGAGLGAFAFAAGSRPTAASTTGVSADRPALAMVMAAEPRPSIMPDRSRGPSVLDAGFLTASPIAFALSAPLRAQFAAITPTAEGAAEASSMTARAADVALSTPEAGRSDATRTATTDSRNEGKTVVARQGAKIALRAATVMRPDARAALERVLGPAEADDAGPALAYADTRDGTRGPSAALTLPAPTAPDWDKTTAIYDITGHSVHLPDGSKLEAHSGRYEMMDNPKYVNVRMRGPTPTGLYSLKLREKAFHGVRALRLTPIDAKMFGRDGMLAHTYMLGVQGNSSGCVVFKNYDAFLQAFLKGNVTHIRIVARYEDAVPRTVARAESPAP